MNSKLTYMYRDASNYKVYETVIISGDLKTSDLTDYYYEGDFFLPEPLGLRSLAPYEKTEDDHIWHEIFSIEKTEKSADFISADKFKEIFKFKGQTGWI